jgi:guanylate kinase
MKKAVHNNKSEFNIETRPLLIVLSGPSGVGKDVVLDRIKESDSHLGLVTTVTTRLKRSRERDNIDYEFVSLDRFQEMIKNNELLEHANVYGNWYGVPRKKVRDVLAKGQDLIVKVDVQGAASIKKLLPDAVFIFLMPPSIEELLQRLKKRSTESKEDLELRLRTAEEEIGQLFLFDYVVVNWWDEVDRAVSEIKAIITAEKCRVNQREIQV